MLCDVSKTYDTCILVDFGKYLNFTDNYRRTPLYADFLPPSYFNALLAYH